MAVTEDLLIKIQADASQGVKGLEQVNQTLASLVTSMTKVEKQVTGFWATFNKAKEAVGGIVSIYQQFSGTIKAGIGIYTKQETELAKLRASLALIGEKDIPQAARAWADYADKIEAATGFDDDMINGLVSMSKIMGHTEDQTKFLIEASADLAAATGKDLESSFRAMTGSLKGNSRALVEMFPLLKNFSDAQFQSGEAIEFAAQKLKGQAEAVANAAGGFAKIGIEADNFIKAMVNIIALSLNFDNSNKSLVVGLKKFNMLVSENTESLVNFGKMIFSVWTRIGAFLTSVLAGIGAVAQRIVLVFSKLSEKILSAADYLTGLVPQKMLDGLKNFNNSLSKSLDFTSAFADNALKDAFSLESPIEKSNKALDKLETKAEIVPTKLVNKFKSFVTVSEEAKKALEELSKKTDDLQKSQASVGLSDADNIRLAVAENLKNIGVLEQTLQKEKQLTKANKEKINFAKDLAINTGVLQLQELEKNNLKELLKLNEEKQLEIESSGLFQQQLLDKQLQVQLDLIEAERIKLETQGLLTKELEAQFDISKNLTKKSFDQKKAQAPSISEESIKQTGDAISKGITASFGDLVPFIGAVNQVVGAAQGVVDAIPNMLNGIADLLNSITSLPLEILKSFTKLLDSIRGFFSSFVKNIGTMAEGLLDGIVKFSEEFPAMIQTFLDQIPEVISKLLEKIPEIASRLASALVAATPQIALSFLNFLVNDAPRVALALMKTLSIELPIAIIEGITKGLSSITDIFKNGFKKAKLIDDSQIKDLKAKLSGATSKLFNVEGLTEGAAASSVGDKLKEATKTAIDRIRSVWQWVLDVIIKPLWNFITAPFMWVWEKVLAPIYNLVTTAFMWVWENVLKPIWDVVKLPFIWVWENVLLPIWDVVKGPFLWVWENVLKPIFDLVKAPFVWVWENVFLPFKKMVSEAFGGIKTMFSGVVDLFKGIFSFDWDQIKSGFNKIFEGIGEYIKAPLKFILNPFIDLLNKLKLPALGFDVPKLLGGGRVNIWNEFDLIPTDIPRLAMGGLVTGTTNTSDNIPAMLSNGEFVMNRRAVEGIGINNLTSMNRTGEAGNSGNMITQNIEINISANQEMNEGWIRNKLVPQIKNELKRASLDGQFIISQKGVRV